MFDEDLSLLTNITIFVQNIYTKYQEYSKNLNEHDYVAWPLPHITRVIKDITFIYHKSLIYKTKIITDAKFWVHSTILYLKHED